MRWVGEKTECTINDVILYVGVNLETLLSGDSAVVVLDISEVFCPGQSRTSPRCRHQFDRHVSLLLSVFIGAVVKLAASSQGSGTDLSGDECDMMLRQKGSMSEILCLLQFPTFGR